MKREDDTTAPELPGPLHVVYLVLHPNGTIRLAGVEDEAMQSAKDVGGMVGILPILYDCRRAP